MIHSVREQRVLRAFGSLNNGDLTPARDYLKDELERTQNALVTVAMDQVQQLQGRARVLKEILELIEQASSRLTGG